MGPLFSRLWCEFSYPHLYLPNSVEMPIPFSILVYGKSMLCQSDSTSFLVHSCITSVPAYPTLNFPLPEVAVHYVSSSSLMHVISTQTSQTERKAGRRRTDWWTFPKHCGRKTSDLQALTPESGKQSLPSVQNAIACRYTRFKTADSSRRIPLRHTFPSRKTTPVLSYSPKPTQ